ncbi:TerB family tellurite resistance protein [Leptolyngbya sp. FACHB-261]|uniref:tellurite resistance TerB family protein n=1 Tax=Leptolyngbya sp. FACHB-261 TaxID=2692806 RepID=UPI0016820848|nr:TerB family tellurite resistance protein [Leptolyngbya sp. FACHB-261]MBD2103543.1 TerB family tellurite resistance protein [Leptolyngbya sp. FACHB-261]
MEPDPQQRLLLKIVLGSAWIDGALQPAELTYLQTLLQRYGESYNRELKELTQQRVSRTETEAWIVEYLNDTGEEGRRKLLAEIANTLFADERISDLERELLDEYHTMMSLIPNQEQEHHFAQNILEPIGRFLKKVIGLNPS